MDTYSDWKALRDRLSKEFPNVEYTQFIDNIAMCVGSPVKTDNPQHELEVADGTSMVMIGNKHDPATVYEWTRAAVKQSGADLITYEGYGHTIYGIGRTNACVNDAVDSYFIDEKRPEPGMSCPAREEPGVTRHDVEPLTSGPYGS